jgi:hypothetical protein
MKRERVWGARQGQVALVVVAVTAVWRAVLLQSSYFNQDDYYLTARAYHEPHLSWSLLFEPVAGHVMPAQQLAFWLVAHHLAFNWDAIAVLILLAQLAAVVVMWHLLTRLLPGRWLRVPLLAAFAWSPLTLAATLWWSAALALWPQVIAGLVSTIFLLRADQGGRRLPNLLGCVAALVFGLLWHERAILTVVLLAGVALCLSEQHGWRRIQDAVVRWWTWWASIGLLCVGYLVLHTSLTSVAHQQSSWSDYLGISWAYVVENALPGLISGPWSATLVGGAVDPSLWMVVVTGVVSAALVGQVWRSGGRARFWALAMLVVYVGVDLLLLLLGRSGFGRIIGLDPRYTSDLVAAAVIYLALAFRGSEAGWSLDRRWLATRSWLVPFGAVVLTVGYGVGSLVGSAVLVPHFQNREDRTYVQNFRADLARDPTQVILDAPVPPGILLPLLGREALLSNVFAPLPEKPVFDLPSAKLRAVAPDGHLHEVVLALPSPMRPGPVPNCGYAVKARTKTIRLQRAVTGSFVVRLGYFTDRESDYRVGVGAWHADFHADVGPNVVWLAVPDEGSVQALTITQDATSWSGAGPTLCVAHLSAGAPQAGR